MATSSGILTSTGGGGSGGAWTSSNTLLTAISNGTITIAPNTNYWTDTAKTYTSVFKSALQDLGYKVDFEIDKDNLLKNNIKGIRKNKFIFKCDYIGNRIQPYEFIMKLIDEKKTFSVTVKVSDLLSICYSGLRFTKIENNLNFDNTCDFSILKVKFEYEKIQYENHKLSTKELRTDKIKKIMKSE